MNNSLPRPKVLLSCMLVLISATSGASGEKGMRTAELELKHDFSKRIAASHHDTCAAMARCGIDYPVMIDRALGGDLRAIRLVMSLRQIAWFDGSVANSYQQTQIKAALLIGDEKLMAAFRNQVDVDYDLMRRSFLAGPWKEVEIQKKLPGFWQLMTERAEKKPVVQPKAEK